MVTPDELGALFALGDGRYNLSMVARVNGVERSRGNLGDIYHSWESKERIRRERPEISDVIVHTEP